MDHKKISAFIASLIITAASVPAARTVSAEEAKAPALLDVSGFTIHDENFVHLNKGTYLRDVSYLFDEQDKVPASAEKPTVDSETLKNTSKANWTPNQQTEYGPASFYIDMGANYVITGIAFLDTNGTPVWTVSDGEPFSWHDIATVNMDSYNWWRAVTFDDPEPTRYLHFSSDYCDSGVSELAIFGYKASELTEAQKKKTSAVPRDMVIPSRENAGLAFGFNAFIDDPMTAIMAAGNVREYHNLSWLIDASGKVKFTQGTWGDMDSYYTAMKKQGIDIIPCFQGGSTVISGGTKAAEIPVPEGADTLDPASYAAHAKALYQVAARYGSNKNVDISTIDITDAQEVRTGMGLLNAIENSNEPNKSWAGKANYFTPYELAAMCSADYDGHEGTIPNAGVHTADPDMRLAMGGLVGYSTMLQYLDEMKLWFDYNRSDGKFAVDIINVHIGADSLPIEDSSLEETVKSLRKWIDENAPGTELWISEFEVPMSDLAKEDTDAHDDEEYQLKYAQRVARTYLTAYRAGADRITKFQLRDEGEGVYYNSGLVTGKGEWSKKKAWYYLACMNSVLKNTVLSGAEDNGSLRTDVFTKTDGSGDIIKCVYSATDSSNVINNVKIDAGGKKLAYLTVPSDDIAEGTTTLLQVSGDSVTVDVSETPSFITFTDSPAEIINGRNSMIRPEAISLTAGKDGEVCDLSAAPENKTLAQFYRMFDEPDTMPDPIYGDTKGMKTPETDVTSSGITAYAFFDKKYVFNGFSVYDTFGTGGIYVYDAHTDELLWSSDLGGYMYRAVTLTEDSAPTDCLKIVKKDGAMNELVFYGYAAPSKRDWDITKDGIWDVFDLIMMKQAVIRNEGYSVSDLVGLSRFIHGIDK